MAKDRFLEAAERCDQLGRAIKERQFGAAGVDSFPVEEAGDQPPEEAWARRFATHVFRPSRSEDARPPLSRFLPSPAGMPKVPDLPAAHAPAGSGRTGAGGHIGAVLGKAGPSRGRLRRLFHGK
jgi:hypothetical protein